MSKLIREDSVPEGYEYAEPETCAFGDVLYAYPYAEDVLVEDAVFLLFAADPSMIRRVYGQRMNPSVNDECWMVVDIGHPFATKAILVGPRTHWLKRKE